jgi:hypothetical protein
MDIDILRTATTIFTSLFFFAQQNTRGKITGAKTGWNPLFCY